MASSREMKNMGYIYPEELEMATNGARAKRTAAKAVNYAEGSSSADSTVGPVGCTTIKPKKPFKIKKWEPAEPYLDAEQVNKHFPNKYVLKGKKSLSPEDVVHVAQEEDVREQQFEATADKKRSADAPADGEPQSKVSRTDHQA